MAQNKINIKSRTLKNMRNALSGRLISTTFLGRHWVTILVGMMLLMMIITNRYQCITAMETVEKLSKELQVVQSEAVQQKSTYMSNIRQSAMEKRIREKGLKLHTRTQPPYKVSY